MRGHVNAGEGNSDTHWLEEWAGTGAGLDAEAKRESLACRELNTGRLTRSQSL